MKKTLKIIVIILIGILIAFGVYKLITYKEAPFDNKIEFDSANLIFNTTTNKFLDTVVYVGTNILGVKDLIITIKPLTNESVPSSMDDYDLNGKILNMNNMYHIYIRDFGKDRSIETISHELIHLKQYYTGKLVINKATIIWEGKPFSIVNLKYAEYPWEIEAFKEQKELEKKMKDFLYK